MSDGSNPNSFSNDDSEEIDPEEQKRIDEELERQKKKDREKNGRRSISAEANGGIKKDFKPRVIPKSEEQKEKIRKKMLENFMFRYLDPKDLETVIDAFDEQINEPGDYIIEEGERGDTLYLVEEGELDCSKIIDNKNTYLKTYHPGESFGELALLYNAARAATIIAKTKCILWELDRECFNNIVKAAAIKRREKNEEALAKVEILKNTSSNDISRICDALQVEYYKAGDFIIRENEEGNNFYILEDGFCYATKKLTSGKEIVIDYKPGQYFGELALLREQHRAANVIAKTDCSVLTLDRDAFKRLLGPLEDIIKKDAEKYDVFDSK